MKGKERARKKKDDQLGMSVTTAGSRLKKSILFVMVKETNRDGCYQCGEKIEHEKDLSIEHKIPWLDSEDPKTMFFDLDNIAFSHIRCNAGARRNTRVLTHGSLWTYQKGCRCDTCSESKSADNLKRNERGR